MHLVKLQYGFKKQLVADLIYKFQQTLHLIQNIHRSSNIVMGATTSCFNKQNVRVDSSTREESNGAAKGASTIAAKIAECTLPEEEAKIHSIGKTDVEEFVKSRILAERLSHSFFVIDLSKLQRRYENWKRLLPRVEIFYAVKCNSDTNVLRQLANLGSNFDCASQLEVELVLKAGVEASRIVFANPCKRREEMIKTRNLGARLTTFDTSCELEKLSNNTPDVKALLRIRADDPTAMVSLGNKFGAEMGEVPGLFSKAKALGIDVVGVCFHIGTGATDPNAFSAAIALARKAFDIGKQQGFDMSVLDIGGGFSSRDLFKFESMTTAVNSSLDLHFPEESGVRIIAEPGRYLMETCAILASNIFGVRERTVDGVLKRDYWITDGIHGSFSPQSVGLTKVTASPLRFCQTMEGRMISSTVFGPTANGNDYVLKDVDLPDLSLDDWLLFPNMGAYSSALSTNFNGMHTDVGTFYIDTEAKNSL